MLIFLAGHHLPTSETSFQWRFAGGLMMAQVIVIFQGDSLPPSGSAHDIKAQTICFSGPMHYQWSPVSVYMCLIRCLTPIVLISYIVIAYMS